MNSCASSFFSVNTYDSSICLYSMIGNTIFFSLESLVIFLLRVLRMAWEIVIFIFPRKF